MKVLNFISGNSLRDELFKFKLEFTFETKLPQESGVKSKFVALETKTKEFEVMMLSSYPLLSKQQHFMET